MRRTALINARKDVNRTQEQVAEEIGVDRNSIGNWERGVSTPTPGEQRARYATAIGITLSELNSALTNLPLEDENEIPAWLSTYLSRETSATDLRIHLSDVVAGLLQTQEYAAAIARSVGTVEPPEEYIQRTKDLRLRRQKRILSGELQHTLITPETPYRLQMGSPTVMADQLDRVVEWTTDLDNVTTLVVPYERGQYEALRIGTFSLLHLPWDNGPLVHLELGYGGAREIKASEEVAYFVDAFDHASRLALSPRESLNYLRRMAQEWRQRADS